MEGSQSGKGGVALILERDYNISLPKWMHVHLSKVVQKATEETGREISPQEIHDLYQQHFVNVDAEWKLNAYDSHTEGGQIQASFTIGEKESFSGYGNGILMALCQGLQAVYGDKLRVTQFDESSLSTGTSALAQTCIELEVKGKTSVGIGISQDVSSSVIQALLTAFAHSR